MRFARRQFLTLGSAALFVPAIAGSARAETYPSQPVRVIVPYAPGGPTDLIARPVAAKLSERLKQQFYIENVPGAGGNLGAGVAAKAKGDGYTMIFVSASYAINVSLYDHIPYDPDKDFDPVMIAANVPTALLVHPSVPAKTVTELVALIKASPGKFAFASPGTGTPPHLVGELFRQSLKLDLVHVPFNGGEPAVASTLAGHTPMGWGGLPPAMVHIQQGTLRALAVASDHRTPALPDVPTMGEAGYPDIVADAWWAVLVPARTPKEIVELLNREMVAILSDPQMRANLGKLSYEPVASTPEQCAATIKATIAKWAKVIREANLKSH